MTTSLNSILPNMRWLCLPSEARGEDWRERAQEIDDSLQDLGFDLSEESVFLIFDQAPGALMNGEGSCMIARPVIGSKRVIAAPLKLVDWVSAPVHKKTLIASRWSEVFQEAYAEWENLQRANKSLSKRFTLVLRRRLNPKLILETEAIFSE